MDPIDERLTRAGAAWRDAQPPLRVPVVVPAVAARPAPWSRWRTVGPLAGVAAVVLVAVAALWAVSPRTVLEVAASPSPRAITLLTATEPGTVCLTSWNGGELTRDDRSGLGVRATDGTVSPVRWPVGFTAYEQAGRAVLVDETGAPVAVDGDVVAYGDGGRSQGIMTACGPELSERHVASMGSGIANQARPLTSDELVAVAADPDALGITVVATAMISSLAIVSPEPSGDPRSVGSITSPSGRIDVVIDPRMPAGGRPGGMQGTFAFTIGPSGVTLDGSVALPDEGLTWQVADLMATDPTSVPVGSLAAVDGWLRIEARRCPLLRQGTSDPTSPFDGCGQVRIAERLQTTGSDADATSIGVQLAAWDTYGVIPGLDVTLPRHDTWLLRRVADPADPTVTGWSVVTRLPALDAITVTLALPTVEHWTGGCRGVGLDATLSGDPADPRVAWLVSRRDGGARIDVIWPPGYRARFSPRIEILDNLGLTVLRDGETVNGGCTTGPDGGGLFLIAPGQ